MPDRPPEDLPDVVTERQNADDTPPAGQSPVHARRHRRVPRGWAILAVVVLVVAIAAVATKAVGSLMSESWTVETACPGYWRIDPNPAAPKRVPAELGTIEAVFFCRSPLERLPSTATRSYHEVWRVTEGVTSLLDTFARPDGGESSCTLELREPLLLWVHHDGKITKVRSPVDDCGKPAAEAYAALDAVTTELVHRELVDTSPPDTDLESGCSAIFRDEIATMADYDGPSMKETPRPLPTGTRACTYEVDPSEEHVGQLVSGHKLTAADVDAINTALTQSVSDPTCELAEHRRFVALWSDKTGGTYVDPDGCVVLQGDTWWRASDDLRELLAR